jgi:hypothetical protein
MLEKEKIMEKRKGKLIILTVAVIIFVGFGNAFAKKVNTKSLVVSGGSGLDLNAAAELFKQAVDLEFYEKSLNDPETGINNLDLDEDDEVDYIRVEETVADNTHLVVLQTQLAENEVQDVATIAIEKEDNETYNLQTQGDPVIYGENYYFVPAYANIGSWGIVGWIYRPVYRPYRSVFGWRAYPRWWRVRRPVTINVYRNRTLNYVGRRNFIASNTLRVKSITKINYRPRTSTLVKKKKVVVKKENTKVVKGNVIKTNKNGTTVKKSVKKTTKTKKGTKTKTKVKVKKKKT